MIASLGMYDMPWVAAANDAIWAGLRDHLRAAGLAEVPESLERSMDLHDIWRSPELLLAQTCGYPLLKLGGAVQVVATPIYDLPGCEGPFYRSLLVVADRIAADTLVGLRGLRAAINNSDSQSGMSVFRATIAPHAGGRPFFAEVLTTGGHLLSLAALREGRADVAAIDCVTYGLTARDRPELLKGTRVIGETQAAPALPLITSSNASPQTVAALRHALQSVLADPALAPSRVTLGLVGAAMLSREAYAPIAEMEQVAIALGYPDLV